jgi:acyl carrier protein
MMEELNRYITEELINDPDFGQLDPTEDLMGSGLLDSLGMMRLVGFIENTYGLRVPIEDLTIENFMSVNSIMNYLSSK